MTDALSTFGRTFYFWYKIVLGHFWPEELGFVDRSRGGLLVTLVWPE